MIEFIGRAGGCAFGRQSTAIPRVVGKASGSSVSFPSDPCQQAGSFGPNGGRVQGDAYVRMRECSMLTPAGPLTFSLMVAGFG